MKVLLGASVICVFIEFQNLFSIQNQSTSLILTLPRVVLALNRNFKMPVNLVESNLYLVEI